MHHPHSPRVFPGAQELHDEVRAFLDQRFPGAVVSSQLDYDFPVFVVEKAQVIDIIAALKSDAAMSFGFLTTMCGLHFPDNKGAEFALVYQLHNMPANKRIRLKVFMAANDLEMPTLTTLWPAANWMEREAFDFYGFRFKGHPDLRRILNMDEMTYHPLRKEYALEDASRHDKEDKYFGR
jgi:NADH-quinone oxidoreductase subunit C